MQWLRPISWLIRPNQEANIGVCVPSVSARPDKYTILLFWTKTGSAVVQSLHFFQKHWSCVERTKSYMFWSENVLARIQYKHGLPLLSSLSWLWNDLGFLTFDFQGELRKKANVASLGLLQIFKCDIFQRLFQRQRLLFQGDHISISSIL